MLILILLAVELPAQNKPNREQITDAMMKATRFMVEKVAYRGGYLWNYAPDFSRVWGELEAKPTMIWVEGGTPAMGETFLDAYEATGDTYYLDAAKAAAQALIWGQHPSGGWAYMIDFAGEKSLRDWYTKVKTGYTYCAQEHLYYYGNCTFDDSVTYDCGMFLMRLYLLTMDPSLRTAVNKCLDFVLESQYPMGGWPQRYPLRYDFVKNGKEDYTSFITLNDGVLTNNIRFMMACYALLGETRVLEPIQRAMTCVLALQGGKPQAGWAMQHKLTLNYPPGHARDFEPAGYAPTATAEMCRDLMMFYRWTGDTKYLARIPDAIEFLQSIKYSKEDMVMLGKSVDKGQILCPTFVEVGTNKPLYLHRDNGVYTVDYDPHNLITHYSSTRKIDIASLQREYDELVSMPKGEATRHSPLIGEDDDFDEIKQEILSGKRPKVNQVGVQEYLDILKNNDYIPMDLPSVSDQNPGFSEAPLPDEVISIKEYMKAMAAFIWILKE